MATLAPDASSWMKVLGKAATEIETTTEHRVRINYYTGGAKNPPKLQ